MNSSIERSTRLTPIVNSLADQATSTLAPGVVRSDFKDRAYAGLAELANTPLCHSLLLILIILLAAAMRFYKLGEWSFWSDELFTVSGREDGFNYTFIRQSLSLTLIQIWVAAQGMSEWNARLVPALVGTISVPLLYFPIKKIFNPTVALAAVLLLAISPWHIYWSQNARFYVPLLLFYTLALLTFHLGIEEDRPWYLVLSLILLGLATKERLLALFFIPVVASYVVLLRLLPFSRPRGLRARNLAIFIVPGLILGFLFVHPFLQNWERWLDGFGYSNNTPFWILGGTFHYIGLPTICMAVVGAGYGLANKNRAVLLLTLGAVIPLLVIMSIAPFHYTANRYVFGILTSWVILASLAAVELFAQLQRNVKVLAVGVMLLLVVQPLGENVLYYRYQNGNRDNWKAAFELVKEKKQPGDLVVAINPEIGNYYLQEKIVGLGHFDLVSVENSRNRVWFVEDMVTRQHRPQVHNWLINEAQLIAVFDTHFQARNFTMRVYLYDPAAQATGETDQSENIQKKSD